jgi:hypothetical protein
MRVRISPPQSCESQEATKRDPTSWKYNWTTLFLWDTYTGICPFRLVGSRVWGSKIWSWVPQNSDPKTTALSMTNSNRKWENRSLVRGGAPYQQIHNCLTVIQLWTFTPDGCLTPRHTGRLTIRCNITLISTFTYQYVRWSLVLFLSLTSEMCVYCDGLDQRTAKQRHDIHLLA